MLYTFLISSALAYYPVDEIKFQEWVQNDLVKIDEKNTLQYSFHRQKKTGYSVSLTKIGISVSSIASLKKIKEINPNIEPCRINQKIEFFEVGFNQISRDNLVPVELPIQEDMLGYFDPRPSESGVDSIVLTKNSPFINFQIITHEVAHHWYSYYCLEEHTNMTSEEFAQEIQFSLKEFNDYEYY